MSASRLGQGAPLGDHDSGASKWAKDRWISFLNLNKQRPEMLIAGHCSHTTTRPPPPISQGTHVSKPREDVLLTTESASIWLRWFGSHEINPAVNWMELRSEIAAPARINGYFSRHPFQVKLLEREGYRYWRYPSFAPSIVQLCVSTLIVVISWVIAAVTCIGCPLDTTAFDLSFIVFSIIGLGWNVVAAAYMVYAKVQLADDAVTIVNCRRIAALLSYASAVLPVNWCLFHAATHIGGFGFGIWLSSIAHGLLMVHNVPDWPAATFTICAVAATLGTMNILLFPGDQLHWFWERRDFLNTLLHETLMPLMIIPCVAAGALFEDRRMRDAFLITLRSSCDCRAQQQVLAREMTHMATVVDRDCLEFAAGFVETGRSTGAAGDGGAAFSESPLDPKFGKSIKCSSIDTTAKFAVAVVRCISKLFSHGEYVAELNLAWPQASPDDLGILLLRGASFGDTICVASRAWDHGDTGCLRLLCWLARFHQIQSKAEHNHDVRCSRRLPGSLDTDGQRSAPTRLGGGTQPQLGRAVINVGAWVDDVMEATRSCSWSAAVVLSHYTGEDDERDAAEPISVRARQGWLGAGPEASCWPRLPVDAWDMAQLLIDDARVANAGDWTIVSRQLSGREGPIQEGDDALKGYPASRHADRAGSVASEDSGSRASYGSAHGRCIRFLDDADVADEQNQWKEERGSNPVDVPLSSPEDHEPDTTQLPLDGLSIFGDLNRFEDTAESRRLALDAILLHTSVASILLQEMRRLQRLVLRHHVEVAHPTSEVDDSANVDAAASFANGGAERVLAASESCESSLCSEAAFGALHGAGVDPTIPRNSRSNHPPSLGTSTTAAPVDAGGTSDGVSLTTIAVRTTPGPPLNAAGPTVMPFTTATRAQEAATLEIMSRRAARRSRRIRCAPPPAPPKVDPGAGVGASRAAWSPAAHVVNILVPRFFGDIVRVNVVACCNFSSSPDGSGITLQAYILRDDVDWSGCARFLSQVRCAASRPTASARTSPEHGLAPPNRVSQQGLEANNKGGGGSGMPRSRQVVDLLLVYPDASTLQLPRSARSLLTTSVAAVLRAADRWTFNGCLNRPGPIKPQGTAAASAEEAAVGETAAESKPSGIKYRCSLLHRVTASPFYQRSLIGCVSEPTTATNRGLGTALLPHACHDAAASIAASRGVVAGPGLLERTAIQLSQTLFPPVFPTMDAERAFDNFLQDSVVASKVAFVLLQLLLIADVAVNTDWRIAPQVGARCIAIAFTAISTLAYVAAFRKHTSYFPALDALLEAVPFACQAAAGVSPTLEAQCLMTYLALGGHTSSRWRLATTIGIIAPCVFDNLVRRWRNPALAMFSASAMIIVLLAASARECAMRSMFALGPLVCSWRYANTRRQVVLAQRMYKNALTPGLHRLAKKAKPSSRTHPSPGTTATTMAPAFRSHLRTISIRTANHQLMTVNSHDNTFAEIATSKFVAASSHALETLRCPLCVVMLVSVVTSEAATSTSHSPRLLRDGGEALRSDTSASALVHRRVTRFLQQYCPSLRLAAVGNDQWLIISVSDRRRGVVSSPLDDIIGSLPPLVRGVWQAYLLATALQRPDFLCDLTPSGSQQHDAVASTRSQRVRLRSTLHLGDVTVSLTRVLDRRERRQLVQHSNVVATTTTTTTMGQQPPSPRTTFITDGTTAASSSSPPAAAAAAKRPAPSAATRKARVDDAAAARSDSGVPAAAGGGGGDVVVVGANDVASSRQSTANDSIMMDDDVIDDAATSFDFRSFWPNRTFTPRPLPTWIAGSGIAKAQELDRALSRAIIRHAAVAGADGGHHVATLSFAQLLSQLFQHIVNLGPSIPGQPQQVVTFGSGGLPLSIPPLFPGALCCARRPDGVIKLDVYWLSN